MQKAESQLNQIVKNKALNRDQIYIDEATFRQIFHKFIHIECPDVLEGLSDTLEIIDGATGVLAYCFCEDLVGTSFNLLASVKKGRRRKARGGTQMFLEKYARVRFNDVMIMNLNL